MPTEDLPRLPWDDWGYAARDRMDEAINWSIEKVFHEHAVVTVVETGHVIPRWKIRELMGFPEDVPVDDPAALEKWLDS